MKTTPQNKTVLIVGSGGREHALAWKVAQSSHVEKVFVAPGNAGTLHENKCENVDISVHDIQGLLDFAQSSGVDLTIVGPETPLVMGIADSFTDAGLKIFAPSKKAAQLEGSKSYAKDFMKRHNIPTARYEVFSDFESAQSHILEHEMPIVIKADGLAAGKGVLVTENSEEAIAFTEECLKPISTGGKEKRKVVIEEFMEGEEASFIMLVSNTDMLPLPTSQDHKLSHDGDTGSNTGGMGAYSPAPVVTKSIEQRIIKDIIRPTLRGLQEDGSLFTGFLYVGLMIDNEGNPRVVEYNTRLGDPEAQPLLVRVKTDLVELIEAALSGTLPTQKIEYDTRAALGVVMAAGGYPGDYSKGAIIRGLDDINSDTVHVFHAGTENKDGNIHTAGGRVLCVTALGANISDAQRSAYSVVDTITWEGEHHRTDIGWRVL